MTDGRVTFLLSGSQSLSVLRSDQNVPRRRRECCNSHSREFLRVSGKRPISCSPFTHISFTAQSAPRDRAPGHRFPQPLPARAPFAISYSFDIPLMISLSQTFCVSCGSGRCALACVGSTDFFAEYSVLVLTELIDRGVRSRPLRRCSGLVVLSAAGGVAGTATKLKLTD